MTEEVYITLQTEDRAIRRHKRIAWTPQPEITAYELAKLTPLLVSMVKSPMEFWEDYIPAEALKHFTISDQ